MWPRYPPRVGANDRRSVAPPSRDHLRALLRSLRRPEGDHHSAVRTALQVAHRVARHPHGVPLSQVHDFVLDLDPRAALDDDVDLFLVDVLVAKRHAVAGFELEVRHAALLEAEG